MIKAVIEMCANYQVNVEECADSLVGEGFTNIRKVMLEWSLMEASISWRHEVGIEGREGRHPRQRQEDLRESRHVVLCSSVRLEQRRREGKTQKLELRLSCASCWRIWALF